jgi:hypothetical protein
MITSVDRSSYLARATYMLLRLQTSTRQRPYVTQEDNSSQPINNIDVAGIADQPHHVPATGE